MTAPHKVCAQGHPISSPRASHAMLPCTHNKSMRERHTTIALRPMMLSKHRNQHLEGTSSCRCDQSALIRTEANCGPRAALGCSRVRALPPPMHARLRVLCAQPMMKCFLPPCLNQIMRDIEHSHFSMTEAPFARVVRAFARLSFATTAEMRFPFVWLLN